MYSESTIKDKCRHAGGRKRKKLRSRKASFVNLQGHNCIFVGSRYQRAVARFIEGVIDSDSHVLLHEVVTL